MAKKQTPKSKGGKLSIVGGGDEPPNLGGAPRKDDEKTLKTIVNAIRMGSHFDVACYLSGLDPKTAKSYVIQGRENPNGIHAKFLRDITQALAEAEIRDLSVIDAAAQGRPAQYLMVADKDAAGNPIYDQTGKLQMVAQLDEDGKPIKTRNETYSQWTAAAWKLERRAPKRWGRYDRIAEDDLQHLGTEKTHKTEEEKVDAGEVEARAKRLKRVMTVLDAVPEDTDLADV